MLKAGSNEQDTSDDIHDHSEPGRHVACCRPTARHTFLSARRNARFQGGEQLSHAMKPFSSGYMHPYPSTEIISKRCWGDPNITDHPRQVFRAKSHPRHQLFQRDPVPSHWMFFKSGLKCAALALKRLRCRSSDEKRSKGQTTSMFEGSLTVWTLNTLRSSPL